MPFWSTENGVTKNLSNICLEFELFHEIKGKDNEYLFLVSCDITC
jgi:hypothetical protein